MPTKALTEGVAQLEGGSEVHEVGGGSIRGHLGREVDPKAGQDTGQWWEQGFPGRARTWAADWAPLPDG